MQAVGVELPISISPGVAEHLAARRQADLEAA